MMSDFVEQALRVRLSQLRREEVSRSIRAAVRDPAFRADVEEVTRDLARDIAADASGKSNTDDARDKDKNL